MAISVPLLFIILIEVALRITGYGHDYDLFIESDQNPGYYVMNEFASEKFFMNSERATSGYYEPFSIQKSKDTYRIFVLGESTTVGFPYGFNGSFHRWLNYRLMFAFPETNFEIINLSLTAVNSYTIADFAKQITNYSPDAVLIYVGHNEYYGALGVGSTFKIGNNPKLVNQIIKLRELKLYQLLNSIYARFRKSMQNEKLTNESLMQHMPADKQIPFESEKYQQAIDQFVYNMTLTCDILEKNNIPVLISNLISNEKDLKPFISDKNPETSAMHFYENAWKEYKSGNFDEAKKLFIKAKELDLLRFRAPEAINREIEKLSKNYKQVTLVDTKSRFEQASPHGIIGKETMLEHVHPNLYGYALMSDAFFNKMKELQPFGGDWNRVMSFEELLKEMPVNEVDSLKGAYQIKFMLNEWPFTNQSLPNSEIIHPKTQLEKNILELALGETTWNKVQGNLYGSALKSGDIPAALKISEAFALIDSRDPKLLQKVATLCIDANNKTKAAFYLTKTFQLDKTVQGAQQLAKIYTEIDKPAEALKYYKYLQSTDPNNKIYTVISGILTEIVKEKQALIQNANNIDLLNNLALQYIQLRSPEAAEKYLLMSLEVDANQEQGIDLKKALNELKQQKQH